MQLMDSLSSSVSHGLNHTIQTIHTIASKPAAVKKTLQVFTKVMALKDLYCEGYVQKRGITDAMKGTIEMIEFYGTFKDLVFWINPFSKDTLDQALLQESLQASLPAAYKNNQHEQKGLAEQIFAEVMQKQEYARKGEVRNVICASLLTHGYTLDKAQAIANQVLIKQKPRPLTQLLSMACFTIADVGGSILTLQKWGIAPLGQLAAQIGNHSQIFLFITKIGAETALGTVASIGLAITFGEASTRFVITGWRYYHAENLKDKEQVYQELRNALLDTVSSGADLVATATPLLFAVNPIVAVSLAIIAKGTGLVCILAR